MYVGIRELSAIEATGWLRGNNEMGKVTTLSKEKGNITGHSLCNNLSYNGSLIPFPSCNTHTARGINNRPRHKLSDNDTRDL